ncbi:MAG: hypothetical protein CSA23_02125 [Deltaproteobacteria bacterium]|nr:MAG: hypothetical protein CSA23_02125 [Deltaproteobacteria bacterium]
MDIKLFIGFVKGRIQIAVFDTVTAATVKGDCRKAVYNRFESASFIFLLVVCFGNGGWQELLP